MAGQQHFVSILAAFFLLAKGVVSLWEVSTLSATLPNADHSLAVGYYGVTDEMYILGGNLSSKNAALYTLSTGTMTPLPEMLVQSAGKGQFFASVVDARQEFQFYWITNGLVNRYDIGSQQALAAYNQPNTKFTCLSFHNDILLLIGGSNIGAGTACFALDVTQTKPWESLSFLLTGRGQHACTVDTSGSGTVYAISGVAHQGQALLSVEKLMLQSDLSTMPWEMSSDILYGGGGYRAVYLENDNSILLVGLSGVQRIDLSTGQTKLVVSSADVSVSYAGVTTVGDSVYIVGGLDSTLTATNQIRMLASTSETYEPSAAPSDSTGAPSSEPPSAYLTEHPTAMLQDASTTASLATVDTVSNKSSDESDSSSKEQRGSKHSEQQTSPVGLILLVALLLVVLVMCVGLAWCAHKHLRARAVEKQVLQCVNVSSNSAIDVTARSGHHATPTTTSIFDESEGEEVAVGNKTPSARSNPKGLSSRLGGTNMLSHTPTHSVMDSKAEGQLADVTGKRISDVHVHAENSEEDLSVITDDAGPQQKVLAATTAYGEERDEKDDVYEAIEQRNPLALQSNLSSMSGMSGISNDEIVIGDDEVDTIGMTTSTGEPENIDAPKTAHTATYL